MQSQTITILRTQTMFVADAGGDTEKLDASEFPVLNMLNTKYFIFPLQGGQTVPLPNPYALGNAWFVDEVKYVGNANEEIEAIHGLEPSLVAVVDKKFESVVKSVPSDSAATIELVAYEPNYLKYEVNSEKGGTVVFSLISSSSIVSLLMISVGVIQIPLGYFLSDLIICIIY